MERQKIKFMFEFDWTEYSRKVKNDHYEKNKKDNIVN